MSGARRSHVILPHLLQVNQKHFLILILLIFKRRNGIFEQRNFKPLFDICSVYSTAERLFRVQHLAVFLVGELYLLFHVSQISFDPALLLRTVAHSQNVCACMIPVTRVGKPSLFAVTLCIAMCNVTRE